MKRHLLFLLISMALISNSGAWAQEAKQSDGSNPRKIVSVPEASDSSGGKNFCICKIVSFTSDNNQQRTDAIFAGSTAENQLPKKKLLKNIQFELAQALIFFYSYKIVRQYAAKADCAALYTVLKKKHDDINRFTFRLPTYASR